jgi:hypothetical protein
LYSGPLKKASGKITEKAGEKERLTDKDSDPAIDAAYFCSF